MKSKFVNGVVISGLFFSVLLNGCTNSGQLIEENEGLKEQMESLKAENESLVSELETLTQNYNEVQNELDSIKESIAVVENETKINEDDISVVVTDKSELPQDINSGRYSNYCTMVFQITNNTTKDIQGIEGTLTVKDLFDKTILEMGCDFVGQTIPSNQTATEDELVYEVNQFIDTDMQFYTTDFEDLKFEYEVTQIVFTDGTVKQ